MEITQVLIPPPVFLSGNELTRKLREWDAPLEMPAPRQLQFFDAATLPPPGREHLLFHLLIHRSATEPQPEARLPVMPQATGQLRTLHQLAQTDPGLRRHARFWQALREAINGQQLKPRQEQLLDIAWRRLGRRRSRSRLVPGGLKQDRLRQPWRESSRQHTQSASAFTAWQRQQAAPAPRAQTRPRRDERSLAPTRDDSWLPKLRPTFSDTDSGDD